MNKVWQVWTPHETDNFVCLGEVILPEVSGKEAPSIIDVLVEEGYLAVTPGQTGRVMLYGDECTMFVSERKTNKPLLNLYAVECVH
jgi:hypothetical protein